MISRSKGILAKVQIEDLTGTTRVAFPIRFIEKPAGDISFFDWRDCQNNFDFLRDIPLPGPVYHDELPPIPIIIGTDLNCLMKLKPGTQQLGANHPMSPLAEQTELGWVVSGFTSPNAPTASEIMNGEAMVLESNVVLSRSQPDPFNVDSDSVFISPSQYDRFKGES